MSLSSAAFCAENLAGTKSLSAAAPGTARVPLTSTAVSTGLLVGASGSSALPFPPFRMEFPAPFPVGSAAGAQAVVPVAVRWQGQCRRAAPVHWTSSRKRSWRMMVSL